MKRRLNRFSVLGILIFSFSICSAVASAAQIFEDRKISQLIDHSNPSLGSYQQHIRILIPDGTPKDAPVLFFLGGEGGRKDLAMLAAPFLKERPVIAIQADHRGYDSYSHDADQTTPTYVNSEQAVEDFHHSIEVLQQEFIGPWALIGYSYPGTLALRLAAKYPKDAAVVVASSALVHFPVAFTGHDEQMQKGWPAGLYDQMAGKIAALQPSAAFDQNWQDRLFLQYVFVGTVQYRAFSPLTGILQKMAALPIADFVTQLKLLDKKAASGLAAKWSVAQGLRTLSLADAETGKFHSRFWAFQQCEEFGTFFSAAGSTKIFPQTTQDYEDYCTAMFGHTPKVKAGWSIAGEVAKMQTPVVFVAGDKDPWFSLGVQVADPRPPGEYLLVGGGHHCPDRDDPAIAKQVAESVFRYLGK